MEQKVNDPENYYKLSEPFASADECNEALKNFYTEINELRKKYKMRDVLIVANGSVRYESGVGEFMQHTAFGSQSRAVLLAAYAYGHCEAEHRELMNFLITGKATKRV